MAWPEWVSYAYVKKLYRRTARELQEVKLAAAGDRPRVALVTSCGVHRRDDVPFDVSSIRGDPSFRRVGLDDPREDWTVTHGHYDASGVLADFEICLPWEELRARERAGKISGLHRWAYSYVGFARDLTAFTREHVPGVLQSLLADRVTACLLTPC